MKNILGEHWSLGFVGVRMRHWS